MLDLLRHELLFISVRGYFIPTYLRKSCRLELSRGRVKPPETSRTIPHLLRNSISKYAGNARTDTRITMRRPLQAAGVPTKVPTQRASGSLRGASTPRKTSDATVAQPCNRYEALTTAGTSRELERTIDQSLSGTRHEHWRRRAECRDSLIRPHTRCAACDNGTYVAVVVVLSYAS